MGATAGTAKGVPGTTAGLTRRRAKRGQAQNKPHKKKQRWWGDTFVYGKDTKFYQQLTPEFEARRDTLLRLCTAQLKVGEFGPIEVTKGDVVYGYRGF